HEPFAIGGDGHAVHLVLVVAVDGDLLAFLEIPDADGLVGAGADGALAVGRQHGAEDLADVAGHRPLRLAVLRLAAGDRGAAGGENLLAVLRPVEAEDLLAEALELTDHLAGFEVPDRGDVLLLLLAEETA